MMNTQINEDELLDFMSNITKMENNLSNKLSNFQNKIENIMHKWFSFEDLKIRIAKNNKIKLSEYEDEYKLFKYLSYKGDFHYSIRNASFVTLYILNIPKENKYHIASTRYSLLPTIFGGIYKTHLNNLSKDAEVELYIICQLNVYCGKTLKILKKRISHDFTNGTLFSYDIKNIQKYVNNENKCYVETYINGLNKDMDIYLSKAKLILSKTHSLYNIMNNINVKNIFTFLDTYKCKNLGKIENEFGLIVFRDIFNNSTKTYKTNCGLSTLINTCMKENNDFNGNERNIFVSYYCFESRQLRTIKNIKLLYNVRFPKKILLSVKHMFFYVGKLNSMYCEDTIEKCFVYKITNCKGKVIYVGSTTNMKNRMKRHHILMENENLTVDNNCEIIKTMKNISKNELHLIEDYYIYKNDTISTGRNEKFNRKFITHIIINFFDDYPVIALWLCHNIIKLERSLRLLNKMNFKELMCNNCIFGIKYNEKIRYILYSKNTIKETIKNKIHNSMNNMKIKNVNNENNKNFHVFLSSVSIHDIQLVILHKFEHRITDLNKLKKMMSNYEKDLL